MEQERTPNPQDTYASVEPEDTLSLRPPSRPPLGPSVARVLQWAPWLWAVMIFCGLLAPGGDSGEGPSWLVWFFQHHGDKLIHGVLFGAQAALLTLSGWRLRRAVGAAIVFGGLLELLQAMTGTRSGDLGDWVADAVGAAVLLLPWCRRFLASLHFPPRIY